MLAKVYSGAVYGVDAYPVEIRTSDVFLSVIGIFVITVLASVLPATRATKFMINN